jgi:putative DNA primase/helicase
VSVRPDRNGANGKSTFLNTLRALVGGYGCQASPQSFIAQKYDTGSRSDIVRISHARFIATSETEQHHRLAESFVKQWTGGEQISTRQLYGKQMEFLPPGKIWLASNHKPVIRGGDDAIWRRIRLVSFDRTFGTKERDPHLAKKLANEFSGILNWAIEGCIKWQKQGLNPPKSVLAAVQQYRDEMDVVGAWIEENCELGADRKELVNSLYLDFKTWAENNTELVLKRREFVQEMNERNFTKFQTTDRKERTKGWFLRGICLRNGRF